MEDFQAVIVQICQEIETLLIEKNQSYGNSVCEPLNLFSKLPAIEQLNVRIDDKLNRLRCGGTYGHEDTELDLIGYLILKRVVKQYNQNLIV